MSVLNLPVYVGKQSHLQRVGFQLPLCKHVCVPVHTASPELNCPIIWNETNNKINDLIIFLLLIFISKMKWFL